MIPGTLCTERTFTAQLASLQGVSEPLVRLPVEGSDLGTCTADILESVPERFALLGFSLGGLVALEVMRRAPERVQRLCLIATNPRGSTQQNFETWTRWRRETAAGGFADIARAHAEGVYRENSEARTAVTEMALVLGPETLMKQLGLLESRPDSRSTLGTITCPTLLIVGQQDRVTPPALHQEMLGLLPSAKLETLKSCGHYAPLERPHEVSSLLHGWLEA